MTSPALEPRAGTDRFREDVLNGLLGTPKSLPCKYFYDARGSQLFDRICELEEYYPTRTESAIMRAHAGEMSEVLGRDAVLVEYGSGSSTKTRILLDHAPSLAAYVPLDISREHLSRSAARLAEAYPRLNIQPVCADYTRPFRLPSFGGKDARWAVYFPGSTIGNFHPEDAVPFLRRIAGVVGSGGGLLIGVDLKKETSILEAAYNDREGVTAAFNMNLLHRMNRELGAHFEVDQFQHHAFYNEGLGRIEMHLVSLADQTAHLNGAAIPLEEDETIHTECSYKYSLSDFAALASSAGFDVAKVWTDPDALFSVQYLVAR
jgi:dimethylhistidine N-methyltransferase